MIYKLTGTTEDTIPTTVPATAAAWLTNASATSYSWIKGDLVKGKDAADADIYYTTKTIGEFAEILGTGNYMVVVYAVDQFASNPAFYSYAASTPPVANCKFYVYDEVLKVTEIGIYEGTLTAGLGGSLTQKKQ